MEKRRLKRRHEPRVLPDPNAPRKKPGPVTDPTLPQNWKMTVPEPLPSPREKFGIEPNRDLPDECYDPNSPDVIVLTPEEMQSWVPPKRELGRPIYVDPLAMAVGIQKYFHGRCFKADSTRPPTIAGLCRACGFACKNALSMYEKRPGFETMIKRARLKVEEFWESRLAGRQSNGAYAWLKNNAEVKYTDNVEHLGKDGVSIFEDMLDAVHKARSKTRTASRTLHR